MIVDTLENYEFLVRDEKFKKAFEFIKNISPDIKDGKYEISEDIFAGVSTYDSIPLEAGKFESHKKYIDIQLILEGVEKVAWKNVNSLIPIGEYDADKDVIFYNKPELVNDFITLTPGLFMVFFPDDAHMPQIMFDTPTKIKKVVVKLVMVES